MEAVNHDHTNATTQRTLLGSPRSLVRDWCSPWPESSALASCHLCTLRLSIPHSSRAMMRRPLRPAASAGATRSRAACRNDRNSFTVAGPRAQPCGKAAYRSAVGSGPAREPLWPAQTVGSITHIDMASGRRHRQQFKLSTYRSGPRATCSWRSTAGTARLSLRPKRASIAGVIERRSPGPLRPSPSARRRASRPPTPPSADSSTSQPRKSFR